MDLFTLTAKLGLDTSDYNTKITEAVTDAQTSGEKIQTALNGKGTDGNIGLGKAIDNANTSMTTFRTTVAAVLASDVVKNGINFVIDAGKEAVIAASNLAEVQNVVDKTFGGNANRVDRWAETRAGDYGLSEYQAKEFASNYAAMFQTAGIEQEKAMEMATSLAERAGDLASFRNIEIEEAYSKFMSGMAGEYLPLLPYGLDMRAQSISEYAGVDMQDMTGAEQLLARYNYMMDNTQYFSGNFADEAENLANGTRQLENNFGRFLASVGEKFLPIAEAGINAANDFFDALYSESAEESMSNIETTAQSMVASIEGTATRAQAMVGVLEDYGEKTALTADQQAQWNTVANELIRAIPELSSLIDMQTGKIEGGTAALSQSVSAWEEAGKAAASTSALEEKKDMLADISAEIANEQGLLAIAEKELSTAQTAMIAKAEEAATATGESFDGTAKSAIDMLSRYGDYYEVFGVKDIESVVSAYQNADQSVKEHQNNITTLQEDYGTVETSIAEDSAALSETVGTMEGDVTESFGAIESATDSLVSNFDQGETAYTNAYNTGIGAANGLNAAYPEYAAAASLYTFNPPTPGGSGETPGFATGLDYVPYNEFPAYLHEGEAVLTKAEASAWRAGGTGGADTALLNDIRSLLQVIADKDTTIMMDGQAVGNLVTPTVSRNIAQGARARRYTT